LSIVSFALEGDFAAFRDPSVTTNQTVTVIPSKSALIGLLGALLGIQRSNTFDVLYNEEYINLLKKTSIGIHVRSQVSKYTFFTNHRSLKEDKTKPYKTELLINPKYTIYAKSTDEINQALLNRLKDNQFTFSPILGHAYCPARISHVEEIYAKKVEPVRSVVSTVFLDEITESKGGNGVLFEAELSAKLVIERHLYYYVSESMPKKTVLRHYIPIPQNDAKSTFEITHYEPRLSLATFYSVEGSEQALCLF
jgi:CRISPR-associated protein Cas5h